MVKPEEGNRSKTRLKGNVKHLLVPPEFVAGLGSYIFLTVHLPPVLLDGEGQHVLLKMAEPTCNQQCALPLHLAVDVNSVQDPWDERGEITETSETSQTL